MTSQMLVHHVLASYLQTDDAEIDDARTFEALGLEPLDLIFVVLRLEDLDRADEEFPLEALEQARTVGDLVRLVDRWVRADTVPGVLQATG